MLELKSNTAIVVRIAITAHFEDSKVNSFTCFYSFEPVLGFLRKKRSVWRLWISRAFPFLLALFFGCANFMLELVEQPGKIDQILAQIVATATRQNAAELYHPLCRMDVIAN